MQTCKQEITEAMQVEILLVFGGHKKGWGRDGLAPGYWFDVWGWLNERSPDLFLVDEFPLKWKGDVEHEEDMNTLREVWNWQRERYHEH